MARKIMCEDCGALIAPRGMASHLRGQFCATESRALYQASLGLVRFEHWGTGKMVARLVQEERLDIEINEVEDTWHPGSMGRSGKVTCGFWAPPWVVRVAELPIPAKTRKKAIKWAAAKGVGDGIDALSPEALVSML